MTWLVLVISGICEAVWAVALGKSAGLTKLMPTIVFLVGLIASMGGLAWAIREIPTGTAYAVWVGTGAALTVTWSMLTGETGTSWLRILLILGLIGCVVGLKLVGDGAGR